MSKPLFVLAAESFTRTKTTPSSSTVVIVGVVQGGLQQALKAVPAAWASVLSEAARTEGFVGKAKEQLSLRLPSQRELPAKMALVGLGEEEKFGGPVCVRLGGVITRLGLSMGAKRLDVYLPPSWIDAPRLAVTFAQGLMLGGYRYTEYLSDRGPKAQAKKPLSLTEIRLFSHQATMLKRALKVGQVIAEHVALARDLVNRPANDLYPETFAKLAQSRARAAKISCKILEPKELAARGMGLLLGVGQGSSRKPRLVHLVYRGGGKLPPVALVGKGITFDSGGLCIKPGESMATMKMDMGGAAAVLSTLLCAQALGIPGEIHAVLALAENMPSGDAIRPGDILRSARGLTVEVNNTDAEGRLVLADALDYIQKEVGPDHIVDVATLTGACMVALGTKTVGLFSNRDGFSRHMVAAADQAGEDFWRLPLTSSLEDQLRSDCADMRNTGERYGGAITAALFLQRFIDRERAWTHLDIAGPAFGSEDQGHLRRGGTGVAVASLCHWLLSHQRSHRRDDTTS